MPQELRDCDRERWEALGEHLTRRRIKLSQRYTVRAVFAREKNVNYRLIYDVERARRQDFSLPMIILIERAYSLSDGYIRQFLTRDRDEEPEPAVAA